MDLLLLQPTAKNSINVPAVLSTLLEVSLALRHLHSLQIVHAVGPVCVRVC